LKNAGLHPIKFLPTGKYWNRMTTTRIIIALGSNVTPRYGRLQDALHALQAIDGLVVEAASHVYETRALLPEDAPGAWDSPFLNMAILGHTSLAPLAMLEALKAIEAQQGRQHRGHWGPREIDLDLIDMEDITHADATLTLPHPAWQARPFVLLPLHDLDPLLTITGDAQTIADHAAACSRKDILHILPKPELAAA
jgi:2-amino-4-hydroxy-6-hydroxymethyldihydropteridine diphosphokinase